MIILKESDRPKSLGEKISEFLAHPPLPILRFYGDIVKRDGNIAFAVRNGLPIPLFYGIYVVADGEYIEKADHIGPFSIDNWYLTLDHGGEVEISVGLVPFEILTDRVRVGV